MDSPKTFLRQLCRVTKHKNSKYLLLIITHNHSLYPWNVVHNKQMTKRDRQNLRHLEVIQTSYSVSARECDIPRHIPTTSAVTSAPGRGVITQTRPLSHLPSDLYGPPQLWLTTRAHCRQHPHTSGTVPPGQSTTDGQSRLLPHPGHCRPTIGSRRQQTTIIETNAAIKFDNMAGTCKQCQLNDRMLSNECVFHINTRVFGQR